jgi:hypothetical protein
MCNATTTPRDRWGVRLIGSPSDIQRIATELGPVGLSVQQLCDGALKIQLLSSVPAENATDWKGYEFARLVWAAARLRFGILNPIHLAPVEDAEMDPPSDATISTDQPTLSQILRIAYERGHIRKALLSYAAGGAAGLFDAYEAICEEIVSRSLPDYASGCGTKEWLVLQEWIAEDEDDRFLTTVLHFRQDDSQGLTFHPFSPYEAEVFVRKVLIHLIEYCSTTTEQPNA